MPWPTYSERFLSVHAVNAWVGYTVPTGHLIVVRSISVTNASAAAAGVAVDLAGVRLAFVPVPATTGQAHVELRQVGYAGEVLRTFTGSGDVSITISGYRFRLAPAAQEDPPAIAVVEPPEYWTADDVYIDDPAVGGRGRRDSVQRGVRTWGRVGRDVAEGVGAA